MRVRDLLLEFTVIVFEPDTKTLFQNIFWRAINDKKCSNVLFYKMNKWRKIRLPANCYCKQAETVYEFTQKDVKNKVNKNIKVIRIY